MPTLVSPTSRRAPAPNGRTAFTLVELSIVLVILGLLVGGVLAGQALIEAATNRKQIVLMGEIETAGRAFQVQYGTLPGDLDTAHEMFSSRTTATVINGDRDGQIGPYNTHWHHASRLVNEMAQFWVHLSAAGLMAGLNPTGTGYEVGRDFPANPASTMKNTGMSILYNAGEGTTNPATIANGHYLWLGTYGTGSVIASSPTDTNGTLLRDNGAVNFLSKTAFYLDTKMDDGKPHTGRLVAPGAMMSTFGTRKPPYAGGSWGYNNTCASASDYINVGRDSWVYGFNQDDPGNCYLFYRLF